MERQVFVKVIGRDGRPRLVDIIGEQLKAIKQLGTEFQKTSKDQIKNEKELVNLMAAKARAERAQQSAEKATLATAREKIRLQKEIAAQSKREAQKTNSYRVASFRAAEKEIQKMQRDRARWEKAAAAEMTRTDRLFASNKIKEGKRAANAAIRELRRIEQESKKSTFAKDFLSQTALGSFVGSSAGAIVGTIVSKIAGFIADLSRKVLDLGIASIETAARFEGMINSLKVATGSARLARTELAAIDETARNTTGLRLETAEQGYTRLRNLGFQAEASRRLIAGLAKERLISNADEQSVDRVIVNLTQLSAGSTRASQDIKEIIHSMPSLRRAFQEAFGTLDPKTIGRLFGENPDEAVEKLAKAMEEAESPAGGLNDALGKLSDAGIEMGRAFGEPFLEPFANDLKDLTKWILENKSAISEWGQDFADAYRTASDAVKGAESIGLFGSRTGRRALVEGPGTIILAEIGRRRREAELARTAPQRLEQEQRDSIREIEKVMEADFNRQVALAENARDKETQALKDSASAAMAILKERFQTEEAALDSHLRYTSEQELNYAKAVSALRARHIQSEIARQTGYFDKLIGLYGTDSEEAQKLQIEKNKAISALNEELKQNTFKTQKDIALIENKIFEERRKAQIDFNQLSLREVEQNSESQIFALQKSLNEGSISYERFYDSQIQIANDSLQKITEISKKQLELQLKDRSLSDEQILNLKRNAALEEQKLILDTNKTILGIQKERYERQKDLIRDMAEFSRSIISTAAGTLNEFSGLLFGERSTDTRSRSVLQSFLNAFNKAEADAINTVRQLSAISERSAEEQSKLEQANEKIKSSARLRPLIASTTRDFTLFQPTVEGVDVSARDRLLQQQKAENLEFEKRIEAESRIIPFIKDRVELERAVNNLEVLKNEQDQLSIRHLREQEELYRNSIDGLREYIKALAEGDRQATAFVQNAAVREILSDQARLLEDNIALQIRIANIGQDSAARYQNAWLRAIYQIQDANIQAVESQIESNVRLADSATFHVDQLRARVLSHLAEQKSLTESFADGIVSAFDRVADFIDKSFGKIGEIPIIGDLLKFQSRNALSNVTRNLLDQFFPSEFVEAFTRPKNPIAKPIVEKLDKTNQILGVIAGRLGANPAQIGIQNLPTLPGIGNIFSNVFGGFGTPPFNPNTGGGFGTPGFPYAMNFGGSTFSHEGSHVLASGRTGSIFDALRNIFSSNQGGIFAPIPTRGGGTSAFGGYASGIGTLAALAGGLIGGRAGGILSGTGSGIATGAALGSFIPGIGTVAGAIIGGAIGFFSSLFGNSKRRRDKKEKLPILYQGFSDAIAQLRQLVQDTKALRVDPESALSKATEIRQQIASGFGLQFESKKYRKQSQSLINSKLAEADALIRQLRDAADIATAAGERRRRILPEFADGFAFSGFSRRNGLLSGGLAGRDSLPALLMPGEIVANRRQQERIRALAGFDVFAYASIPNYPKPKRMAEGGFVGGGGGMTQVIEPKLTLELHNMSLTPDSRAYLRSENGRRVVIDIYKDAKKNNEL